MKRFMKGCAVTALIFAVLGAILAFVGSSVAGMTTIAQVMDDVTRGRIRLRPGAWWKWNFWMGDSCSGVELAEELDVMEDAGDEVWEGEYGCDYGQWDWDESDIEFKNEYEVSKGDVDRFCPGEDIRKLELELGGCTVCFVSSESQYLSLEADNAYKFQSYLKGNTLHVKAEGKSMAMENWMESESCNITLYVPEGYVFDEVELNLGAGYVQLGDLYAQKASLEVGAGEIDIHYAEVPKMDISIGAGSVMVTEMEVNELEAEVGMGSFQAEGEISHKADIQCSMGYVELYLRGEESDFNYEVEGAMGYIEIGGMDFGSFSQERKIDNGASKSIEVECSMGSICILFME